MAFGRRKKRNFRFVVYSEDIVGCSIIMSPEGFKPRNA
jgi:hypothetical protein